MPYPLSRPWSLTVVLTLACSGFTVLSLTSQEANAAETSGASTTPAPPTHSDPSAGTPEERPFTITRSIAAPRDLVFKCWTEQARLQHWFGPSELTFVSATNDLRPGGTYHYCLRSQDGVEFWGRWTYREVVAPERLVYVDSFSDKAGGVTRHPMCATWPLETLTTLTLVDKGDTTVLTLVWIPIHPTPVERATFADAFPGMTRGWNGTFNQLASYLASLSTPAPPAPPALVHP